MCEKGHPDRYMFYYTDDVAVCVRCDNNRLRAELEQMNNARIVSNKIHLARFDELNNQKEYYGILFDKFQKLDQELATERRALEMACSEIKRLNGVPQYSTISENADYFRQKARKYELAR